MPTFLRLNFFILQLLVLVFLGAQNRFNFALGFYILTQLCNYVPQRLNLIKTNYCYVLSKHLTVIQLYRCRQYLNKTIKITTDMYLYFTLCSNCLKENVPMTCRRILTNNYFRLRCGGIFSPIKTSGIGFFQRFAVNSRFQQGHTVVTVYASLSPLSSGSKIRMQLHIASSHYFFR